MFGIIFLTIFGLLVLVGLPLYLKYGISSSSFNSSKPYLCNKITNNCYDYSQVYKNYFQNTQITDMDSLMKYTSTTTNIDPSNLYASDRASIPNNYKIITALPATNKMSCNENCGNNNFNCEIGNNVSNGNITQYSCWATNNDSNSFCMCKI